MSDDGKVNRTQNRPWTAGLRAGERCPSPAEMPAARRRRGLLTAVALALAALGTSWADVGEHEPPGWVKTSFIGSNFILSFLPRTTDWVAVEWSADGVVWKELVNVAANASATVYADVDARSRSHRLYRLRSPGTAVSAAGHTWAQRPRAAYRFQVDRLRTVSPFLVQATVEVRPDGKRILDVVSDGFPVVDPDPDLLPSIEELFERLEARRTEGARQVWATYDPTLGYPTSCTLDLRNWEPDGFDAGALTQFRLSRLTWLE